MMRARAIACLVTVALAIPTAHGAEQLRNLPVPDTGLRYPTVESLDPVWPAEHGQAAVCLWGDDKPSALSISIDDNNVPDIPFWQAMSQEFGWHFTWFVIIHPYVWDVYADQPGSNIGYFGPLERFKELQDQGHEIGLHASGGDLLTMLPDQYVDQTLRSKQVLEAAMGQRIAVYAYPYGRVDPGDSSRSFAKALAAHFIAARGTVGHVDSPARVDYLQTGSMGALGTGQNLVENNRNLQMLANRDRPFKYSGYRGWGTLLYHGVKQEESRAAIRVAFAWLKQHESDYWIRPYGTVARYAQERESATLTVSSATPDAVELTLTDRMDDTLFDSPLTIKVAVDGWTDVKATQDGKPVAARMMTHDGRTFALVEAVPDRGVIRVTRT